MLYFENNIIIKIGSQLIRESNQTEFEQFEDFKISKDSYDFLNNLPSSFYYYKIENDGIIQKKEIIHIKYKKIKSNILPKSELYNEYLKSKKEDKIITTDIIYNIIGYLAYSTWKEEENNKLVLFDNFPAELKAKIYSIKYSINLEDLIKKIKGEIKIEDVFAISTPQLLTKQNHIKKQLEYGIKNKDILLLKKNVFEVSSLWGEHFIKLIEEANILIDTYDGISDKKLKQQQKLKQNLIFAISTQNFRSIKKYLDQAIILNNPDFEEIIQKAKKTIEFKSII
tara:strand:- start:59 stop:907 length:849 start_codon:yes stop_codon:yes gene_type:complete